MNATATGIDGQLRQRFCVMCGVAHDAGVPLCAGCGAVTGAVVCPVCGTAAAAGQRACAHCGVIFQVALSRLSPPPPAAVPASSGAALIVPPPAGPQVAGAPAAVGRTLGGAWGHRLATLAMGTFVALLVGMLLLAAVALPPLGAVLSLLLRLTGQRGRGLALAFRLAAFGGLVLYLGVVLWWPAAVPDVAGRVLPTGALPVPPGLEPIVRLYQNAQDILRQVAAALTDR